MKIKSFSIISFLALLFLTSCFNLMNCIDGEGEIVERQLNLSEFSSIHLKSGIDVILKQGDDLMVSVKGNANIIENLKTEVESNTWEIEFEDCLGDYEEFTVYITLPYLHEIGIYGSGSVTSKNDWLRGKALSIAIYGSGDVQLNCEYDNLDTEIKGSGDVELKGSANKHSIEIAGSGDINASELITNNSSIDIKGSGDVTVNSTEELNVEIKGSGDVYYFGDPPTITTDIKGSGNISKK